MKYESFIELLTYMTTWFCIAEIRLLIFLFDILKLEAATEAPPNKEYYHGNH